MFIFETIFLRGVSIFEFFHVQSEFDFSINFSIRGERYIRKSNWSFFYFFITFRIYFSISGYLYIRNK